MVQYGPKIIVNGKQPEWLRDEVGLFENSPNNWLGPRRLDSYIWGHDDDFYIPISIRLPADHWYYTVARINAEQSWIYWPGGDEGPPADWDRGEVLYRDGYTGWLEPLFNDRWSHIGRNSDIIGYRRAATAIAAPEPDPDPAP